MFIKQLKYIKTILKTEGISNDSFWLTTVRISTVVLNILTIKLLTEFLSLHEYGTYSQGLLLITSLSSITIFGLTDGINYFYNSFDFKSNKNIIINTIFFIECMGWLILGILLLIFKKYIVEYFKNEDLNNILFLIFFLILLTNLISMHRMLILSIGKAKDIAKLSIFVSIFKLIIVILSFNLKNKIFVLFGFQLIIEIFELIYLMIMFGKFDFFVNYLYINKKYLKEILGYCIPLYFFIFSEIINKDIDKYIIQYFTNTETFAIYSNCSRLLPFNIFTASYSIVLIPIITKYISSNKKDECNNLIKQYLMLSVIVTWILSFGAIICSKDLICVLYNEKFLSGNLIFICYILVEMFKGFNLSIILKANGDSIYLLLVSLLSVIINVILDILLFFYIGASGPAIATVIVTLFFRLLILLKSSKILNSNICQMIDIKLLFVLIFHLFVSGLIVHFFSIKILPNFNNYISFVVCYLLFIIITMPMYINKIIYYVYQMNKVKFQQRI